MDTVNSGNKPGALYCNFASTVPDNQSIWSFIITPVNFGNQFSDCRCYKINLWKDIKENPEITHTFKFKPMKVCQNAEMPTDLIAKKLSKLILVFELRCDSKIDLTTFFFFFWQRLPRQRAPWQHVSFVRACVLVPTFLEACSKN